MADHDGASGPVDGRIHIWMQDDIFMPDHNKVVRYITSRFALQTCDEGHSWKFVTADQREWYWDEFVNNEAIRHLWYKNVATLYRRTIHAWRTTGRYPETVSEARWAAWTAAWHDDGWLERAGKNKMNRSSEPAGPGTGTSKHIAGSKTYSAHYQSLRAHQGADPTSWDLYLHTHRRPDGSFVNERSRLVHQSMENLRDESLTPYDDETIPDHHSSEEVNSMFKHVVGGRKKGRMYGCGSMATTIYPYEMAPRPRGGGSRSSQESQSLREAVEKQQRVVDKQNRTIEQQSRVVEFLRVDLQASQRQEEERDKENELLRTRLSSVEDQIRRLVSGMPQVPPVTPHTRSAHRTLYHRGTFSRGRATGRSSRHGPDAVASFRGDPFAASSSREKQLRIHYSTPSTSPQPHRFTQQWVDPSQDFGADDDDDDGDDDGGDDGGGDDGAYDDDETQAP